MIDTEDAVATAELTPLRRLWEFIVRYQAVVVPLVALGLAFSIGALLIQLQGVNPSGLAPFRFSFSS